MQATNSYYQLKELTIDQIIHPEWGINDFRLLQPSIETLRTMMLRIGNDIEKINEIPSQLAETGNAIIDKFYSTVKSLKNFDLMASRSLSFKD